jgi:CRP-like cAMP-binding protein
MSVPPDTRPRHRIVDKPAILRSHWLFGKLDARAIERLAACMLNRSVKRGTTIFAKGDESTSLFAIGAGTVKIGVPSADGRDAVFNLLDAGDIFGEIAILDGHPRTADAIAVTDCELFTIERREFLPLVASHPDVALKLIEMLCARLRHTSEQVEDILFLNLPMRLAKTLLRMTERTTETPAKIAITQRDLGQMIGMSRESTNKQLRVWAKRKWIELERGGVTVLAPDRLAEAAEEGSDFDRS